MATTPTAIGIDPNETATREKRIAKLEYALGLIARGCCEDMQGPNGCYCNSCLARKALA